MLNCKNGGDNMTDSNIVRKAADITTEIVAAKMGSSSVAPSVDTGKRTADFYAEVYKGVFETLKAYSSED